MKKEREKEKHLFNLFNKMSKSISISECKFKRVYFLALQDVLSYCSASFCQFKLIRSIIEMTEWFAVSYSYHWFNLKQVQYYWLNLWLNVTQLKLSEKSINFQLRSVAKLVGFISLIFSFLPQLDCGEMRSKFSSDDKINASTKESVFVRLFFFICFYSFPSSFLEK